MSLEHMIPYTNKIMTHSMLRPGSCETLGHLLQHEVDGDVLLKGHGGEVVLKAAYCTAAWSKVFWDL